MWKAVKNYIRHPDFWYGVIFGIAIGFGFTAGYLT